MMVRVVLLAGILGLIVAGGVLYQILGARRSARRYPPPGAMTEIDGQRLHLMCVGTGRPAVLFEAGIAASSLSWTRVIRDVGAFTRACAYDRAGLGWSEPSQAPRTVTRMVAELRGILATGAPGPAVLVGHSFGAFLILAYASQYPADVAGLVLLDPPTEWHGISGQRARVLWGGIQLSRVGGVLARVGVVRACLALLTGGAPGVPRNFVRVFGPTAARTLEHLVGEVRKLPPEVHPVVQSIWCQPKCFRAMAEHLAAFEETAAAADRATPLPDVPLAVVSSGDQPADIIAQHRQLARLSSQGRHVVAAQSGHWIQLDEPDLVVRTIEEVVEEARRTRVA
jgi:pimeloyl-ACP methyl ester carboxylesterase